MGRPQIQIDLAELEKLYGMQCTDEEVAAFFGIGLRTLQRRLLRADYQETKERSLAKGRVSIRRNLFKQANGGGDDSLRYYDLLRRDVESERCDPFFNRCGSDSACFRGRRNRDAGNHYRRGSRRNRTYLALVLAGWTPLPLHSRLPR